VIRIRKVKNVVVVAGDSKDVENVKKVVAL